MIGSLPTSINVDGQIVPIETDYRVVLVVFLAMDDPNLSEKEKAVVFLDALIGVDYVHEHKVDVQKALEKCTEFVECNAKGADSGKKILDWEQDEQLIFSAVNHVAGTEVRSLTYLHWWTFLGYFNEISEGLLSTVISIRQKLANNKKLEKYEQEYYRKNKAMIDLKNKYTDEELEEQQRLLKILGG